MGHDSCDESGVGVMASNRWSVSVTCALCSNTISRSGEDHEALSRECDKEAVKFGWRLLQERNELAGPRRYESWICSPCFHDILRIESVEVAP